MEQNPTSLFRNPRIIGSAVFATLIVAGAFFASYDPKERAMDELTIKDVTSEEIHQDLDGDGLELWQEDLWKTDPKNPDSDVDGTSDGEEVKVGRDPNKKGPKDRKDDVVLATSTLYYDDDPSLNTTDIIARDLFSGAVALEQTGQLTDENVDVLIGGLIEKAQRSMEPIKSSYTPNDIRVSPVENAEVYRSYFNGIALIILSDSTSTISENDTVTMWTATDMSLRKPIALKEATRNKRLRDGLLTLVVPAELAKPHMALIGALDESREILTRIANAPEMNPIVDLFLLQEFQARVDIIAKNIEALFASPMITTIFWTESDPMAQIPQTPLR